MWHIEPGVIIVVGSVCLVRGVRGDDIACLLVARTVRVCRSRLLPAMLDDPSFCLCWRAPAALEV
jgi:hypothetical protein